MISEVQIHPRSFNNARLSDSIPISDALHRLEDDARLCTPALYASLLQRCGKAQALADGRRIHSHIVSRGYQSDRYLCNLLVQMYGRCGSIPEAYRVFESIQSKNVFSWNIMLAAFARNGLFGESRQMFEKMPERDSVSWNEMIGAYVRIGRLSQAKEIFDRMPQADVVSWTLLASAYAEKGKHWTALLLFRLMDLEGTQPDKVMFVIILDTCATLSALKEGMLIHECVLQTEERFNIVIKTTLVNMYGKCGAVADAKRVFDECPRSQLTHAIGITLWNAMIAAYAQNGHLNDAVIMFRTVPAKDVVSWNTMVAAFAQNDRGKEAMQVFGSMDLEGVKPDAVTFLGALDACSKLEDMRRAEAIHQSVRDCGLEPDIRIGNALVNMYGKCGSTWHARAVFDRMSERNVVTWSALISAYSHNGRLKKALSTYRRMNFEGIKPNPVTLLGAIDACAGAASPEDARLIHSNVKEFGLLELDPVVGNAVINMHAKCGNLSSAMEIFRKQPNKTTVTWNTVIGAYAHFGHTEQGIELFREMSLEGGVEPNEACFTAVFSICNHAGMLDVASDYFVSMVTDYGLAPITEHYHCMLDLLGRAGRLAEVEELISSMPYQPDLRAWTAFVDACKTHGEFRKGNRAAERMFGLQPENSGPYALLSNMYASY